MSETLLRRLTAGLGGMAVALLLIGLVVQRAQAVTVCGSCTQFADAQALRECQNKKLDPNSGQCRGIRQGALMTNCYTSVKGNPPLCPNGTVKTGKVNCGTDACRIVGDVSGCSELMKSLSGGSPCNSDCWSRQCSDPIVSGSSGSVLTCGDVQVGPIPGDKFPQLSNCYSACQCK